MTKGFNIFDSSSCIRSACQRDLRAIQEGTVCYGGVSVWDSRLNTKVYRSCGSKESHMLSMKYGRRLKEWEGAHD